MKIIPEISRYLKIINRLLNRFCSFGNPVICPCGCFLALICITGYPTTSAASAVPLPAIHDQGTYTIPVPKGWSAEANGGHSFFQSDSGGCFSCIDQNVAAQLIAGLDQISWSPVPPGRHRLKIDETINAEAGAVKPSDDKANDPISMLCEGNAFDIELFEKAMMSNSLDLMANCPRNNRQLLIDNLAFVPDIVWASVLALVTGKEHQLLLNLRLAAIAASLSSGRQDILLRQLNELATTGAQPITKTGEIDSVLISKFLLWGQGPHEPPERIDEAIGVLLKLIDNLAALNANPPDLGGRFWAALLREDGIHEYPTEKRQLLILARLQKRFGVIAPVTKDDISPLQMAISDAPQQVMELILQLTRSHAITANMLRAAIERERWGMLTAMRKIDLRNLSDHEYQSLLVAATNKALDSGTFDHLNRLFSARTVNTASIDSLLELVLNSYEKEFHSFGWKTVDYLLKAGASPERVLGHAKDNMNNPCSYMLYHPERFGELLARGFDVTTPLPVIGQKDMKVNALMLFLMCRDPRQSEKQLNLELGKTLLEHTTPDLLNIFCKATNMFPLSLAAGRSLKMADMMVAAGADPNAQDPYGNTLLMMASAGNEIEIVNFLLSAGADVNQKNSTGINALGYAECYGAEDSCKVLTAKSSVSEGADVCRKIVLQANQRSEESTKKK